VLGYACCASCSNVSRVLHYYLPHSRGLSGETSSTPVSRRAQSLVETPSHPAYLASYWSICLGSQLMMAQSSQRIDTVKLMYSGRPVPLFKSRLVPPQAGESDPTLVCVRVDSRNRTYHIISPQHTSKRLEHSKRQKEWSEAALHEAAKSGFVRN
jgi:hypothetical protein